MKRQDISIGQIYLARIGKRLGRVQIIGERARTKLTYQNVTYKVPYRIHWIAKSLRTGQVVEISSARIHHIPTTLPAANILEKILADEVQT